MEEKQFIDNFIKLIKLFKNKPHFLTKFLLNNYAFDKKFVDTIQTSEFLTKIKRSDYNLNFKNFDEMNQYFFNIVNSGIKNIKETKKDFNKNLKKLLDEEKYEEASKLRDYMKKNKIDIK